MDIKIPLVWCTLGIQSCDDGSGGPYDGRQGGERTSGREQRPSRTEVGGGGGGLEVGVAGKE